MERFSAIPTVSCVVTHGSKLLVLRRQNSNYMNGYFCLPGGHVEAGETLQQAIVRELFEETGLQAAPLSLRLCCVVQTVINGTSYLRFIFRVSDWTGDLELREPEKASDLGFYDVDDINRLTPSDGLIVADVDKPGITYLSLIENDGVLELVSKIREAAQVPEQE